MNSFTVMQNLKNKLAEVIVSLQSDKIIQQMRNDSSLYSYKMQLIRQLINQQLHLQPQLLELSQQNEELKIQLEQMKRMSREYAVQIQNIQLGCKELIMKGDKEKKQYEQRYQTQINQIKQQNNRYRNQINNIREENNKLKNQNQNLKDDRIRLQRHKADSEEYIQKLKKQADQKYKECQRMSEQNCLREAAQYEQIISKMQKDMYVIKDSWQKKCSEQELRFKQEMSVMGMQFEQKFRRDLKEHAESLKLGNSVIISDSEEIIAKKVEFIEQGFRDQLSKAEEKIKNLQEMIEQYQQELEQYEQNQKLIKNQLKMKDISNQKLQKDISELKTRSSEESKEIAMENNKYLSELKKMKTILDESKTQNKQSKEELSMLNKKCLQLKQELDRNDKQKNNLSIKIGNLNSIIDDHLNQIIKHKQLIISKEQLINTQMIQIDSFKANQQHFQKLLKEQKIKCEQLCNSLKKQKQKVKYFMNKIDRVHLNIRRLRKQQQILKQQVKCMFEIIRNKVINEMNSLNDQCSQWKDSIDRRYKQKIGQLLDQMQGKERDLIDSITQEKEQVKSQIKQYTIIMARKDQEINRIKLLLSDTQREKRDFIYDLEREKDINLRLDQKIQANQHIYASNIARIQKQVAKVLSSFNAKWIEQLNKTQQELDIKDEKIRSMTQKIDQYSGQYQDSRKQQVWYEEEIKKFKKKYQNLKSQRDQKIETLLKKLDQEGKHRLNLQKELKQMRMTVMKGSFQQNNNFSFNNMDKEKQFTNNKPVFTNSKEEQNRQRERELSQIRDMIAKTYKVVGDGAVAERDIGRNISKRNLF